MSVVVVNTVKQLYIIVRPHRYNICPDKTLHTLKTLCREVASRRWRYLLSEANNINSDEHLTYYLLGTYSSLRSLRRRLG